MKKFTDGWMDAQQMDDGKRPITIIAHLEPLAKNK